MLHPERDYYLIMTHYPTYYTATCQNEKISYFFVKTKKKNIAPKTLSTLGLISYTGVDRKHVTFLDSGHYMHSIVGRPMQVNGAFHSVEKSRVIKHIVE